MATFLAGAGCTFRNFPDASTVNSTKTASRPLNQNDWTLPVTLSDYLFAFPARRYTVEIIENVKQGAGFQPAYAITPELRDRVAELQGEGKGIAEIGRLLGLNRKQVARILEGRGIKNTPNVPASSRLAGILKLHGQGKTHAEIGELLGFSRKAIGRALQKARRERPGSL